MSRLVWTSAQDTGKKETRRQTTLSFPRVPVAPDAVAAGASGPPGGERRPPVKRERPADVAAAPALRPSLSRGGGGAAGGGAKGMDDEETLWGPSGGGNRETQGGRHRGFMAGRVKSAALNESPYTREFVAEWKDELRRADRGGEGGGGGGSGGHHQTGFDEGILAPYLAKDCPRDVFRGCVFFLNSCGSDALASVYLLERLLRYMGGTTALGVSNAVTYVVATHLSSAKEAKVRTRQDKGGHIAAAAPKIVHPHFILECAKQGRLKRRSRTRARWRASLVEDRICFRPNFRNPNPYPSFPLLHPNCDRKNRLTATKMRPKN